MDQVGEFFKSFLSRKFLLVVFALALILTGNVPADYVVPLIVLVVSYLTAEGAGDAAERYGTARAELSTFDNPTLPMTTVDRSSSPSAGFDDDTDTSVVVAGEVPL